MTTLNQREQAFEAKFKHEEEQMFKATARRNRLVGMWMAEKLGKTGAEADAYAVSVVAVDFDRPGDDDVIEKLLNDANQAGIALSREDVVFELQRLFTVAMEQIRRE
jgi:hypothetical protein